MAFGTVQNRHPFPSHTPWSNYGKCCRFKCTPLMFVLQLIAEILPRDKEVIGNNLIFFFSTLQFSLELNL